MKLLTTHNPKTVKGEKRGFLTAILHLAPSDHSGRNVCPMASPACKKDCLFFAGRGKMHMVINARISKTNRFFDDRAGFLSDLKTEITAFRKSAIKKGMIPTVRLNGLSDLNWERVAPELFTMFHDVQFYDYTKITRRMNKFLSQKAGMRKRVMRGDRNVFPPNYHLTFSRSETNERAALDILNKGGTVAVLFRDGAHPKKWKGFPVLDGDESDLRFLETGPAVIGLRPKGPMSKDETGFVVDL